MEFDDLPIYSVYFLKTKETVKYTNHQWGRLKGKFREWSITAFIPHTSIRDFYDQRGHTLPTLQHTTGKIRLIRQSRVSHCLCDRNMWPDNTPDDFFYQLRCSECVDKDLKVHIADIIAGPKILYNGLTLEIMLTMLITKAAMRNSIYEYSASSDDEYKTNKLLDSSVTFKKLHNGWNWRLKHLKTSQSADISPQTISDVAAEIWQKKGDIIIRDPEYSAFLRKRAGQYFTKVLSGPMSTSNKKVVRGVFDAFLDSSTESSQNTESSNDAVDKAYDEMFKTFESVSQNVANEASQNISLNVLNTAIDGTPSPEKSQELNSDIFQDLSASLNSTTASRRLDFDNSMEAEERRIGLKNFFQFGHYSDSDDLLVRALTDNEYSNAVVILRFEANNVAKKSKLEGLDLECNALLKNHQNYKRRMLNSTRSLINGVSEAEVIRSDTLDRRIATIEKLQNKIVRCKSDAIGKIGFARDELSRRDMAALDQCIFAATSSIDQMMINLTASIETATEDLNVSLTKPEIDVEENIHTESGLVISRYLVDNALKAKAMIKNITDTYGKKLQQRLENDVFVKNIKKIESLIADVNVPAKQRLKTAITYIEGYRAINQDSDSFSCYIRQRASEDSIQMSPIIGAKNVVRRLNVTDDDTTEPAVHALLTQTATIKSKNKRQRQSTRNRKDV